jgi:hypothetical protein
LEVLDVAGEFAEEKENGKREGNKEIGWKRDEQC